MDYCHVERLLEGNQQITISWNENLQGDANWYRFWVKQLEM